MVRIDLRRVDFEGNDYVVWFEIQLGDSTDTSNVCYRIEPPDPQTALEEVIQDATNRLAKDLAVARSVLSVAPGRPPLRR